MHQSVVIRPSIDAANPGFKKIEVTAVQLVGKRLEQQHSADLLFQYVTGEETVGDLNKKFEPLLVENFSLCFAREPAQVVRVPAVRLDVFFEEPLHAFCVFPRTSAFECGANLGGNLRGTGLSWHF